MKTRDLLKLGLWWLMLTAGTAMAADNNRFVDVSIQIFTRAVPPPTAAEHQDKQERDKKDPNGPKAEPVQAVLATETRLLPMYLRYRLEQSGSFGAVRVVPQPDQGAELRITGEILKSDGSVLELAIKAQDSSGKIWLDRSFKGTAAPSQSLNGDQLAQDDFASLFGEIVSALKQQAQQLDSSHYDNIHNVALLRYGLGLAPAAFSPYLDEDKDGTVSIKRMPANDDPLFKRILDIRDREYQFIDVVDEDYGRFYTKAYPLYVLWRQSEREQVESSTSRNTEALANTGGFSRGSYHALLQSYNNYRWVKLQELYVDELGEGFTNEVEPTQVELNDSVFRLTGNLDQQYRQWRDILAQLLALDKQ